jgi:hypothetical protein
VTTAWLRTYSVVFKTIRPSMYDFSFLDSRQQLSTTAYLVNALSAAQLSRVNA